MQVKALLSERFHSLEDFKADERYRMPHDDHRLHGKQVRIYTLHGTAEFLTLF